MWWVGVRGFHSYGLAHCRECEDLAAHIQRREEREAWAEECSRRPHRA